MTTEQRDKMRAIGKVLSDAMAQRKEIDWSKETPATIEAQAALDEQVARFVLEDGTREQVRQAYQQYAKACA